MTAHTLRDLAVVTNGVVRGDDSVEVEDVEHDSRHVRPGSLFVAVRGESVDGHDFVARAASGGASAVCVERPVTVPTPQLVVGDTRKQLGPLAAAVHGHPSRAMSVVGVTGTNGKTTVTHLLESMADVAGLRAGLIGTIESRIAGTTIPSSRTTPEATDLQRLLAAMRDDGCSIVAMEVSSHALVLGRVDATRFEVAAFTNLSQDHLDFHGDMDGYRLAKLSLFTEHDVGTALVNVDDPTGQLIATNFAGEVITVGERGMIGAEAVETGISGTSFRLRSPWGGRQVKTPLVGHFNVGNTLLAVAASVLVGMDFDSVVDGLDSLPSVPGRFELVSGDDPVRVIVDYAHTPEGVAVAIETARALGERRVIALVGAGGDRDRAKRPLMGSAAARADFCVITTDNPRSEDPGSIIESVIVGLPGDAEFRVEPDRKRAIELAISNASDGDLVLILGKGHERFQDVGDVRLPFDDRAIAKSVLAELRSAETAPDSGSMSA